MPIHISASGDTLCFYFQDYYSQLSEFKRLTANLHVCGFSMENEVRRNLHSDYSGHPSLSLFIKISDIYDKQIVNFVDFENKIMLGFEKIDSLTKITNLNKLTFYYIDGLGSEENRRKYYEEKDELLALLDEETCDLIDWYECEDRLDRKYKVKSDHYLKTFFHEENNKRFIACAQGNLPSKENASPLMFLPVELMLKITGYVDPLYPQGGKKMFADVEMKRSKKQLNEENSKECKMEISEVEKDSFENRPKML